MHPLLRPWLARLSAWLCVLPASAVLSAAPFSTNANRLAYLDEDNPFYPHRDFPRLITPQWVGEPGVEAVVILAIDDMRDSKKYETFLRPILDRLKRMDGRAPVSIFANIVTTNDTPQLEAWLKEGLSLEVHTLAHPCPLLQKGSFTNAWNTYHGGVDLLSKVPGNKPVAFRMPCCDSMNSPSPRFYAEIFNRTSPDGNFLQADSSVMCLLTDDFLKRHGVTPPVGQRVSPDSPSKAPAQAASSSQKDRRDALSYTDHFRRYFPAQTNALTKKSLANFGTYIEDYPYPYVINRTCWEFPAMVPSDWEAFNAHGPTNAATVADWQLALDAVVRAQGVFTFIFHPHGWIRSDQIIQFIDHAERTHGKKVKFLTFKEAVERLNKNLLKSNSLRASNGMEQGVRLLDLNNDGIQDVVIGSVETQQTGVWRAESQTWAEVASDIVTTFTEGLDNRWDAGVKFAPWLPHGNAYAFALNRHQETSWKFSDGKWAGDKSLLSGLTPGGPLLFYAADDPWKRRDLGVRLRDFDRDGRCELLVSNDKQNALFAWSDTERTWKKLPYALPPGLALVNERGEDNGLRFVDLNGDGFDDLILSNEKEYAIYLWAKNVKPGLGWHAGWSHKVLHEQRAPLQPSTFNLQPPPKEIPPFVRSGPHRNNGAWFHKGQLFVQNEDTAHLPDVVWRKSFSELIAFDVPPPKSPAESQKCFAPKPGFRVELVAAEPQVESPCAFEWDARGRLWVVEMRDYPLGMDGKGKPGGRVKILEDLDGDGFYEKSTVFLDNLPFPNGVMPWRNGVLISTAPNILYAEDTDGDGKADVVKVLFTGFREGNQQHRLNGFEMGLDNWIYGANGDSGGTITFVSTTAPQVGQRVPPDPQTKDPAQADSSNQKDRRDALSYSGPPRSPVSISGRDFRFRPDTGEFEAIEGQTQFGRRRDDWANWFGNNNPTWLWHYWLPDRYLRRNPHLAVKSSRQMLANYPDSTRCFPISTPPIRFNQPQSVNHVTSGCSPAPYRDDLFGPGFATSVFISEPVHNLVHREVLVPDGVSFTSRRAPDEQDREFLASTDNWFRPTMLKTGPDGALYLADFYRFVLEHPEWIAPETQARLDLRAGADKGRIWRVVPVDQPRRPVPNLAKLNTTQLVAALDSPSGWQRDTVQRLLVERQDKGAVEGLKKLAVEAKEPKVRVQAIGVIDGLGVYPETTLLTAIHDPHPGVREQVGRVVESYLTTEASKSGPPSLAPEVLTRSTKDTDPRVRFQTAFAMGNMEGLASMDSLVHLAANHWADPRMRIAISISSFGKEAALLRMVAARRDSSAVLGEFTSQLFGQLAVAGRLPELASSIAGFGTVDFSGVAAVMDSLERNNSSLARLASLGSPEGSRAMEIINSSMARARTTALSQSAIGNRQSAIVLLGRGPSGRPEDLAALATLLKPQQPAEIQTAAVAQLAKLGGSDSANALLADWKAHSPALREAVLSALLSRPAWTDTLLAALERGQVAPTQISPAQRQKLTTHPQAALRDRATKLFAAASADRAKVIKDYAVVTTLTGSETRGRELFTKNCGVCHKLKGEGREIGPDLGQVITRDTDWLLTAILDPNAAVESRYLGYTAETKSGREFTGIITAETPNNLVMRGADGTEETILRTDLKQLLGSGLSLMPEGMESALKPQDMADLLAFIRAK